MRLPMLQQEGSAEDFLITTARQVIGRCFIDITASKLGWGAIASEVTHTKLG